MAELANMITIAIPCLNEARNIRATIESIIEANCLAGNLPIEIVVIDDGSTDNTVENVKISMDEYACIKCYSNNVNMGLGYSIQRAIDVACGEKFLIVPGDNDMSVNNIAMLLKNSTSADIVMMYFVNDEIRGRARYILSTFFRLMYTCIFDLYVLYINGPAVYPISCLKKVRLNSRRFSIVAEINVKLLRMGATFLEIPGFRNNCTKDSKSLTLKNLGETISTFALNAYDVFIRNRALYSLRPLRVMDSKEYIEV